MLKKVVFYCFILLSVAIAIWGYFRLKENKAPSISATEHIPNNVSVLFQTTQLTDIITQLTRQNLIWNSLQEDSTYSKVNNHIHFLDSVVKSNSKIASVFDDNTFYSCFFENKAGVDYLLLLKAKETSNETVFKTFCEGHFKATTIAGATMAYEINYQKHAWYLGFHEGLLYISASKAIIEKSIALPSKESIALDSNYKALILANGLQKHLIYTNRNCHNLFNAPLLLNQAIYHADIKPNAIALNGYAIIPSLNSLFQKQKASVIDVYQQLPAKPSSMVGISISNANEYMMQFEKNCNDQELEILNQSWKTLTDSASYNIKKEFLENTDAQVVSCYYPSNTDLNWLTAIKIKDSKIMEEMLKLTSDSTTKENEIAIYHLATPHQHLFSFINFSQKHAYALISDDVLILANNKQTINSYLQNYNTNNTISKDKEMMIYAEDNFSEACHILHYNDYDFLTPASNEPLILNPKQSIVKQKSISKISYTAKYTTQHWQVRLNATHAQKQSAESTSSTNLLWETYTDSALATTPFIFTNHSTQENEICFQTTNKELYLINATGNLLWKKTINEIIQSKIYTVDIFKNGKLQLLFNTENYIHLIDRNGNEVQGFPVKTPAKITSSITLLDYDNNKDYRLLIACNDKRIYNYSIYGIKTEGFIPFKTNDVVTLPIKYVKVGLSDYLVAVDVEGKIYAFSRKGEGRIALTNRTTTQIDNYELLAGNTLGNTKLVFVDDRDNLLNKISLSDKKETLKLGDEILGFNTQYVLLNEDEQTDVLCYGNEALYGYDVFSNKLIEYFSSSSVFEDVQVIRLSHTQYYIAFDKAQHKIDVLNNEGKLLYSINEAYKAPLIKDIFKDGTWYIIYSDNHSIKCKALI